MSLKSLAISPRGAEFLIYKAIVSNNFFPNVESLISLSYYIVLKVVLDGFFKNTLFAETTNKMINRVIEVLILFNCLFDL